MTHSPDPTADLPPAVHVDPVTPPSTSLPGGEEIEPSVMVAKTYAEALKLGEEYNREILLFFTASWCGPCQVMKADLDSAEVREALSKRVMVILDIDQPDGKFVGDAVGVYAVPAYVMINPRRQVLKTGVGRLDKQGFVDWLNNPQAFRGAAHNDPPPVPQVRYVRYAQPMFCVGGT